MKVVHFGAAIAALAAVSAFSAPAHASPFYVKASVGQTTNSQLGAGGGSIDLSDSLAYGGDVGTSFGPVRVEAGVDHLAGAINLGPTISATALDYHATGYLDLPVGSNASVYAGAGVDYVDGSAHFFGSSISGNGTGWHYAVGAAYRLNDRMIGEVQVRHIDASLSTDYGDVDFTSDEVTAGVRFAL